MHLPSVIIAVFTSWLLSLLNDSTDATVTGISLEGCFKNLSHYTTLRNLSDKNGPRHCFDECNNTEYIGLQKQDCFCNATPGAYATERYCNFSCPGDRSFSCGSDNAIYVYHKEQTNIIVDGEFGFVYLHVYKSIGDVRYRYEIIGTNNITAKRPYICYDEPSKCDFKGVGTEKTWLEAKSECLLHNKGLVPYRIAIDETICTTALPGGYFWIGMSWFKPDNIVSESLSLTSSLHDSTDSPDQHQIRHVRRRRGRESSRRGTGRESSRRGTGRESGSRGRGRATRQRRGKGNQGPSLSRIEVATTAEARDHQLKERIANMTQEGKDNLLAQICQKHPNMVFEVINCSSTEQQGYHPRPRGKSPSWCICSNCREMPADEEKQCCKQIPPNCYSRLPTKSCSLLHRGRGRISWQQKKITITTGGKCMLLIVSTTTISTTSVITTTQRTTTMRRTTTMTTVTSTTSTNIKSESVTLYSTIPVKKTSSGDKISTPIAVFVIIPVVLIATVVSVVIFYKNKLLCFKNRVGVDESIRTTQLEIPSVDPLTAITTTPNTAPGSTIVRL